MINEILKLEIENITPTFFGTAEDSRKLDGEFRVPELIASWKRNILRLMLSTSDNNKKNLLWNIFNKLKQGNYAIKIENYKKIPIGKIIIITKRKFALDLRFKQNNKIVIPLTKHNVNLSLYINQSKFDEEEKKYIVYSFIYTIQFSGIGKISSKGFGKFKIKSGNVIIGDQNQKEEIIKVIREEKNNFEYFKEKFKLNNIIEKEIKVNNWKDKLIQLINNINKNKKDISINYNPKNQDLETNFFVYYLLFTCASKMKVNWKNYPRQSGRYYHTFILGLPRFQKGTGYKLNIDHLKIVSQIKYVPLFYNKDEFRLLLIVYPYCKKIIEYLLNQGLTHCGSHGPFTISRLGPADKISQDAINQAFDHIEKIYNDPNRIRAI